MILNELHKLGISAKGYYGKDQNLICPKCRERKEAQGKKERDKSLSVKIINADEAVYKCHAAKCGFKGGINLKNRNKSYSRPAPWTNSKDYPDHLVKEMQRRGISEKTLDKMDIRAKGFAIEFPYFRNGELINIKTKYSSKSSKKGFRQHKGAEKILYNVDSLEGKEQAIMVEGEMAVLALVEAGLDKDYGIVSIDQGAGPEGTDLGGKLECFGNCTHEISKIKEWILFLDNDNPGRYTQKEIARRLGEHKCRKVIHSEECKDANDYLIEGVLPLDRDAKLETLRYKIKNAEAIPVAGIKELDDDVLDAMIDALYHGRKQADTTGFNTVDNVMRFKDGHLTLFTGIPNRGKGQVMRNLAIIQSLMHGIKWGVYAIEDYGTDSIGVDEFYEEIAEIYLGKKLKPIIDLPEEQQKEEEAKYRKAAAWIKEHFICIDPPLGKLPTNDWLNEKLTYLKQKYGVDGYIKDPWNKIFKDKKNNYEREDEYLARVLSEEKMFARGWRRSWIVNHPNQLPRKKDGTLAPITIYSLNGGAMWANMMDMIAIIDRPHLDEDPHSVDTEIKTIKIKQQKLVAKPGSVSIYFNLNKRRFCEMNTHYDPIHPYMQSDQMSDADRQLNEAVDKIKLDDIPF